VYCLCTACILPTGPAHKHTLIKLDVAGEPHQHHDLLTPKQHQVKQQTSVSSSSSSRDLAGSACRQQQQDAAGEQQQQQRLEAQRSIGHQVLEIAAAAAAAAVNCQERQNHPRQQQQQQGAPGTACLPAVTNSATDTADIFGEASDIQLEELEALQVPGCRGTSSRCSTATWLELIRQSCIALSTH